MHPGPLTTGTVILEALVNGLPVITTSACGYAKHVRAAGAGIVLEEPFDFKLFLTALKDMADTGRRAVYSEAGIGCGRRNSFVTATHLLRNVDASCRMQGARGKNFFRLRRAFRSTPN